MSAQSIRVNPSEEIIQIGATQIRIRFLLTGDNTNGLMSVFEFSAPAGLKLPAPAHFSAKPQCKNLTMCS